MTAELAPRRRIRSYVRRERPLKAAAAAAYDRLWPRFGLPETAWYGLGRNDDVVIDIGFGDGEALLSMATADPARRYVGVEMYRTGIVKVMRALEERGLNNVGLIEGDAETVVARIGDARIDAVLIFFPDPWPKARHHKRRLVRGAFLNEVARILRPGGLLHFATDWAPYADEVASLVGQHPDFGERGEGRADRPVTRFERRGQKLGHDARDLRFRRRSVEDADRIKTDPVSPAPTILKT